MKAYYSLGFSDSAIRTVFVNCPLKIFICPLTSDCISVQFYCILVEFHSPVIFISLCWEIYNVLQTKWWSHQSVYCSCRKSTHLLTWASFGLPSPCCISSLCSDLYQMQLSVFMVFWCMIFWKVLPYGEIKPTLCICCSSCYSSESLIVKVE